MTTKASLALWRRREKYRRQRLAIVRKRAHAKPGTTVTAAEAERIHKWEKLLADAVRMVKRREQQLADTAPLRLRAFKVAESLVGVMESGGNNAGPMVSRIIRENGGTGPEPWCGSAMAYCYRHAGSKAVTRAWAAVRLLAGVAGLRKTRSPLRGDLVRFTFSHVGMFVADHGNMIETIEGNTGASGAVSDSAGGGDGVYRKRRSKSLVQDYIRVTR